MLLGVKSDYAVMHLNSLLVEQEHYWVLKTPNQPNYYFGNFIALKQSITEFSVEQCRDFFQHEFSANTEIKHQTFVWPRSSEDEQAQINNFLKLDFHVDETHVLSAKQPQFTLPQSLNNDFSYRLLATEQDWNTWKEISCLTSEHNSSTDSFKTYLNGQVANYQALERAGCGHFLGAFKNGQLVGYAGLYHHNGLARFQSVAVDEKYRGLGIAKSLISHLVTSSPKTTKTWIIQADENYHATKLYQNLGFNVAERQGELCYWPDN